MGSINVNIDDLQYPNTYKHDLGTTVIWYAQKICDMKRYIRRCKQYLKVQPNHAYFENQMYHMKTTIAELEKDKNDAKAEFYALEGEPIELAEEPDTDSSVASDHDSVHAAQGSLADLSDFDDIEVPNIAGSYTDSAESSGALNTPRSADESTEPPTGPPTGPPTEPPTEPPTDQTSG